MGRPNDAKSILSDSVKLSCLVPMHAYFFFSLNKERRKSQKDEQEVLGGMLCLPTRTKRSNSGLWENDVFPGNPNEEGFPNPLCFDGGSHTFRPCSTFTPGYLVDDPMNRPQLQNRQFDDINFAFPQIATMRQDQMGEQGNR